MPISIRSFTVGDLAAADSILNSAFQRSESWDNEVRLFQKLQPDGIFLAHQREKPAGMVASITYSNYAYVGMMGVHQNFQRQGVGLALMEHLLAHLEQQDVRRVMLDASPYGQPLYEKLGFTALKEVYVLQRKTGQLTFQRPQDIQPLSLQNLDLITAADQQAFGADRSRLLQALLKNYPKRAFLSSNGYLISQGKRIGPWVIQHPENAELLLRAALSLPFPGPVSVVVPGENMDAVTMLQNYGFEIVRVNRHMVRGLAPLLGDRTKIFAQTSLSLG